MANRLPAIEEREERTAPLSPTQGPTPAPPTQESPPPPGRHARRRWFTRKRWWVPLGVVLLLVAIIAALSSHLFDERLRRTLEGKINSRLTGYQVTLGHAH